MNKNTIIFSENAIEEYESLRNDVLSKNLTISGYVYFIKYGMLGWAQEYKNNTINKYEKIDTQIKKNNNVSSSNPLIQTLTNMFINLLQEIQHEPRELAENNG